MRALLSALIVGLIALGLLLVGCGGDEEQQQTQQTEQSAPQATEDRAASEQRSAQQAQRSETQQAGQAVEAQPERDEPVASADPLPMEARAALESWLADLEAFEMVIDIDFNLGGLSSQLEATVAVRSAPFMALTTIDASSLMAFADDLADDEQDEQPAFDEPLLMQVLISDDAAYLSMSQLGGWIDLSDQFEESLAGITAMLGVNPDEFAQPDQFGQAFDCVDVVGGSISEGRYAEQAVWFIECRIDVDELSAGAVEQLAAQGIELTDVGIESMRMRLAISQATGAPVLVESDVTLRDAFGLIDGESDDAEDQPGFYVSTVAHLLSWNEPVEFPTPEPLVDGSLLGEFAESDSAASPGSSAAASAAQQELLEPDELLQLTEDWLETVAELELLFATHAVIDGEDRLASSHTRLSRSQGFFETSTRVDDANTFRLLWNRDGIWTSEAEVDGRVVWEPSSPALLGLSGTTVDDFLASPDRYSLRGYRELLDLAWLARTIEGGGPPIYELMIESGPLAPGDSHFDQVAELLKSDIAELLAEGIAVEAIEYFSATITINGATGAVISEHGVAEFQTTAGRIELTASVSLDDSGTIEFSSPTQ